MESIFGDVEAVQAAGLNCAAVRQLWSDFLQKRPGLRYTDVLCLLHLLYWVRRHRLAVAEAVPVACERAG